MYKGNEDSYYQHESILNTTNLLTNVVGNSSVLSKVYVPIPVNKSGSNTYKTFKNQSLYEEHFENHGKEIEDVLGKSNYSTDNYLDDANYIINNGTYTSELNGYVKFMSGNKYGFVGLDRTTGEITTFHIKNVSELIEKAPSLGFGR